MNPALCPFGSFSILQASEAPGMLQSVPEVEDLATARKYPGAFPDPLRAIPDHHHHGVSPQPSQLLQLGPETAEDSVGIAQTSNQKTPHQGMPPGAGFHSFVGPQQHPGFHFAKLPFLDRRQGRQRAAVGRASPAMPADLQDRKSTRLNSSHLVISYAVFCLKKRTT